MRDIKIEDSTNIAKLPSSLVDLSAEWIGAALASNYPGVEVTSLYLGTVLHGTCTNVRLLLTYNDQGHAHRLPPTMFAKCGFEANSTSSYLRECARSEVVFYRLRASEGLINTPKCYFSGLDEKSGASFLLLEDLLARNVTFGTKVQNIDPATAQKAVAMMARLHARWWNKAGPPTGPSAGAEIVTDVWMDEANFNHSMTLPRFKYVVPALRDRDLFRSLVHKLWVSNTQGQCCILHGDLALGNCFFELDGTPGFLDGQGDTVGCWAYDFTNFLLGALETEDRRTHERPLLEFYLEELRANGADAPPFEDAWRQYRRNAIWKATAAVCPVTSQPEDVLVKYTKRAMAAVADLDAIAAFDE